MYVYMVTQFVKKSMPPGLSERYNRKMETPEDIFRESHKELIKSKGEWAARTAQACSVVSTLVASVAYGACTNMPGGYDDKGYAIHRNKLPIKIFRYSSSLALSLSLMSAFFFLSVVASPSQSIRSWRYIPFKLYFGMDAMLISIVSLWISFDAGQVLILNDESWASQLLTSWIAIVLFAQYPSCVGPSYLSPFFDLLRTPIQTLRYCY
ncbi:hypothetical protein QN277_009009 [Acacia crassicarpa]|uniref:PGG domain-containing protein n=1 Tax=Acacia crassicarpa TaxID=499986 RepID=A0AAE1IST6_9FABA|nr:hypothetical protein QN277_009009 [Acacia crassicarpa]